MTANTDGVFYQNARRYDAITRALSSAAPVEFYRTQLSLYGPSTLELACGTGRIALPLAEAGMDVSALDCSPEMLALAQSKARQAGVAVRWIEADMRRFTLGRRFDSVFVASNSLSHLPRRTDLQACFASVHSHLAPGGRFLVDVFNPALSILQRPPDERDFMAEYEDTEVQDRIAVSKSVRYAAATQILYETWYFRSAKTGIEEEVPLSLRMFFPEELDALLHYNGFQIELKFGDYARFPFRSDSGKQLIVCSVG